MQSNKGWGARSAIVSKRVAAGLALLGAGVAHADATLKVASPQGEVALVRQVRATFSESMVKFGDPRLPAPLDGFDGAPAMPGSYDAVCWTMVMKSCPS